MHQDSRFYPIEINNTVLLLFCNNKIGELSFIDDENYKQLSKQEKINILKCVIQSVQNAEIIERDKMDPFIKIIPLTHQDAEKLEKAFLKKEIK